MTATGERTDPWAAPSAPTAPRADGRRSTSSTVLGSLGAWALGTASLVRVRNVAGASASTLLGAALLALLLALALRVARERGPLVAAVRLLVVAAATGGSVALIGLAPTAVLVGVVVVADAALNGWRPFRGWPMRRGTTVPLAVGLLVGSQVAWIRNGPVATVLVLVALAGLVVEAAARAPAAMARVEGAVARGTSAVASGIVRAVLLVVALVVLYLPGALASLVRRAVGAVRRPARDGSNLRPVGTTVGDARRDARRPFTSTDPAVRARRTLGGLALVAVVALVAVAVTDRDGDLTPGLGSGGTEVADDVGPSSSPDGTRIFATELALVYSELPAYEGVAWADELQEAQARHVVNGTLTSRYANIRGGRRVTSAPAPCESCPHASLWFSGGSAAFGTGQRDDHTIASDLVRIAAREDGIVLDVTNVSHDGYTFQLESQWEVAQSLRTEEPPDLLVFYNGWNDVMAQLAADYLRPGEADRTVSAILPPDLAAINEDTEAFLRSDVGPEAGRTAAARYRRIQDETDAMAGRAGVETAYFLQADALTSAFQLQPYERLTGLPTQELLDSPLGQALDAMAESLGSRVVDLRGLFAGSDEPVFLGLVHQNERGAETVAERIYQDLRPRILELAR